MRTPNWLRLFPDRDFRWSMALQTGDGRDFFSASAFSAESTALRRKALAECPEYYAVLPDSEAGAIGEALELISGFAGRPFADAWEAGAGLEPDWVILRPDAAGIFHVVAGVVCFPSFWSLPEKAGRSMLEVHGPVPGLNDELARQIDTFLGRLAVGAEWERENWGLSADAEMDHHPRHPRPPLTDLADLESTWLRMERQLFVRLPGGGLLFGIRVSTHRLDQLCGANPHLAPRLARALETMPDAVARYKNLGHQVRSGIVRILRECEVPLDQAPTDDGDSRPDVRLDG